ncbi:MAG: hypothetical protein IIA41_09665 [SAR324 cluster bacterium]|nr:hypothetical protein [SAR324 cluster bacterium]
MSTRAKLIAAGAVVAVAAVLAFVLLRVDSDPQSADKQVWNYSIWGPPRAFTAGIEKAKEILEEAGAGRFELKIHYAGAIAPAKEHLDAILIGLIEAARICVGYYPGKMPLAQVLELPFILTDDTLTNVKIIDAVFRHPLVAEELAQRWNTKYLFVGVLTPYEFMGNRRIASLKDMRGVRMRISGANATLLEEFDAVATMVTAPEAYTALERGTIDMIGFPWTDSFGVFRLHEVSQYATIGIGMGGFACMSGVSIDAWNRLPDDLKALLPRIRDEAVKAYIDAYARGDERWIPIFEKRLEIVHFPESERAKMVAKAIPLWAEWAAKLDAQGMAGTEMLEFTKAQAAKFSQESR